MQATQAHLSPPGAEEEEEEGGGVGSTHLGQPGIQQGGKTLAASPYVRFK